MTDYRTAINGPDNFYRREAQQVAAKLPTDATIMNGVMRWKSNNNVPPQEIIDLAAFLGFGVDAEKCGLARDADTKAFLDAYRASYTGPCDEEKYEARAAFGPDVELINVITGHKWTT